MKKNYSLFMWFLVPHVYHDKFVRDISFLLTLLGVPVQGVRLELRTLDRRRLLADVTRTFRENGLSVTRADVTTKGKMAVNEFYVTDTMGNSPDPKIIDAVIKRIGEENLHAVEEERLSRLYSTRDGPSASAGLFHIGSLVRRNLYYLGLVKSCS